MYTKTKRIAKKGVVTKALAVGDKNHGFYKVMPKIGVIKRPMEANGWRFLARDMDDAEIPNEADRQVQALRENGIVILQEIVGHNLIEEKEKQEKIEGYKNSMRTNAERMGTVTTFAGVFIAWVAQAVIAFVIGIISFALAIDPALIVVLEDGTWLCVAEWDS